MKKVLSVLLAAAMVMGMSVSAMARPASSSTTSVEYGADVDNTYYVDASTVSFNDLVVVRGSKVIPFGFAGDAGSTNTLEAGDELYFYVKDASGSLMQKIPYGWKVKMSSSDHVKSAEMYVINGTTTGADNTINNKLWNDFYYNNGKKADGVKNTLFEKGKVCPSTGCAAMDNGVAAYDHFHSEIGVAGDAVYKNAKGVILGQKVLAVKVVLDKDFDHFTAADDEFFFYIYDSYNKTESDRVSVEYNFSAYAEKELVEEDLDWVLHVNKPTTYIYGEDEEAAKATVDFNGLALGEFKMWAGEEYTLYASSKYNKELSKEYDEEIDVITFTLGNVDFIDVVFPAAKDAYQIVAVVDGELVPVEATFVEDHKFASGKVTDGYLVEGLEAGKYAVVSADLEIAEEEVEAPAVEVEVETEKANPETGAADFVGAAVAMAVVSVAAAGALALKK